MAQRQGAALSPQAPALSSLWPPHRGPPQAHLLPTVLCPSLSHWGPFLSGPCTPHKWVGWRDWQANPITQRGVVPWAFCSEAVTFLPASLQLRNAQFPQPSVTVARQGLPRPLPGSLTDPAGGKGNARQTRLSAAPPPLGWLHPRRARCPGGETCGPGWRQAGRACVPPPPWTRCATPGKPPRALSLDCRRCDVGTEHPPKLTRS